MPNNDSLRSDNFHDDEIRQRNAELLQELKTVYRKRADDTGLNFRRYVTGINTGGIIITLYVCKTLIDNKINPFDTWILFPFSFFVSGLIFTGISNYVAKIKRVDDVKRIENGQKPIDWGNPGKSFYKNTMYEVLSLCMFVLGIFSEIIILLNIELI